MICIWKIVWKIDWFSMNKIKKKRVLMKIKIYKKYKRSNIIKIEVKYTILFLIKVCFTSQDIIFDKIYPIIQIWTVLLTFKLCTCNQEMILSQLETLFQRLVNIICTYLQIVIRMRIMFILIKYDLKIWIILYIEINLIFKGIFRKIWHPTCILVCLLSKNNHLWFLCLFRFIINQ